MAAAVIMAEDTGDMAAVMDGAAVITEEDMVEVFMAEKLEAVSMEVEEAHMAAVASMAEAVGINSIS